MDNQPFNKLQTTRIGNIAEKWIKDEFLPSNGYIVWWNGNEYSTPFDGIANNEKHKNKNCRRILVEVKCKTKNGYGNFSIHSNDLVVYKEHEEKENRLMNIFFVNPEDGKLYLTNLRMIKENPGFKPTRDDDGKELTWISGKTGIKEIASIPQNIIQQINKIQNEK
jgi:hypothetical protein